MTDIVKRLREGPDGLGHLCDDSLDAADEIERLCAILGNVADIAHSSGLVAASEGDALVAVRRLTLGYWDACGTEAEHRHRVRAAMLKSQISALDA